MIGAGTCGAPNWVDLSTSNVEAAIEFYSALLGWTVTRSETHRRSRRRCCWSLRSSCSSWL